MPALYPGTMDEYTNEITVTGLTTITYTKLTRLLQNRGFPTLGAIVEPPDNGLFPPNADWAYEHWGSQGDLITASFRPDGVGRYRMSFITPGSAPHKILEVLSIMIPTAIFTMSYTCMLEGVVGCIQLQAGQLLHDVDYSFVWDTDAMEFLKLRRGQLPEMVAAWPEAVELVLEEEVQPMVDQVPGQELVDQPFSVASS